MQQALFESLIGTFMDGTPVESLSIPGRVVHSVMDNLNRIFNTRVGSIPHLKYYGLPDIGDIYQNLSSGIDELREAIRKSVMLYEPRMKNVRVIRCEDIEKSSRLVFILSGEILSIGLVQFQTTFISTGQSTVSPWKKPQ